MFVILSCFARMSIKSLWTPSIFLACPFQPPSFSGTGRFSIHSNRVGFLSLLPLPLDKRGLEKVCQVTINNIMGRVIAHVKRLFIILSWKLNQPRLLQKMLEITENAEGYLNTRLPI